MNLSKRLVAASKASGAHFLLSLLVAAFAAGFVFGLWYPFPYRELMGGRELFLLVIAVDVVCGPLLTLVLYNPTKPKVELARDLGLVAIIQLAALIYGLHTVMVVRPVFLVYEVDRFNAISAIDVDDDALGNAAPPWNALPLWGPKVIAARAPRDQAEMMKSLDLSLQGSEPSARPDWWQSIEVSRPEILKRARLLAELRQRHANKPSAIKLIDAAVKESGKAEEDLRWLPLTSRRSKDWVVLIDAQSAVPFAYASVDGF